MVTACSVPMGALAARYGGDGEPVPAASERTPTTEAHDVASAPRPTAEPTRTPRPDPTVRSTTTDRPRRPTSEPTRETTPTPDPEPERAPGTPDSDGTRCAASVLPEGGTERRALHAADERYGTLDAVRVFETVPSPWPGRAGLPGRDVIVSLKMTPSEVLGGRYDERLREWFRNAPRDREIYWSLHHEPEDNVQNGEFTTEQFRRAWQRVADLADTSDHPKLYATLILMDWTLDPRSGRDWREYYVEQDVDVLAFDVYNHGRDQDPPEYYSAEKQLSTIVRTAREAGKPFGIAELGSIRLPDDHDGSGRAAWITDLTTYLEKNDALWVAYFDIDHSEESDYRLRDEPSIAAWREFCAR